MSETARETAEFIDRIEWHLREQLEARDREIERLQGYLERAGWRRCDIAACNCNGYHNWNPSQEEIEEPLKDERDSLKELLRESVRLIQSLDQNWTPRGMEFLARPEIAALSGKGGVS